jgi:hypothetical protein
MFPIAFTFKVPAIWKGSSSSDKPSEVTQRTCPCSKCHATAKCISYYEQSPTRFHRLEKQTMSTIVVFFFSSYKNSLSLLKTSSQKKLLMQVDCRTSTHVLEDCRHYFTDFLLETYAVAKHAINYKITLDIISFKKIITSLEDPATETSYNFNINYDNGGRLDVS